MVKQLFQQEFTGVPECLYDLKVDGPYHSPKSQLITLINNPDMGCYSSNLNQQPHGLVDLSVIIRSVGASIPAQGATSKDFARTVNAKCHIIGKESGCTAN